jgi:hypothetical protein
MLCLAQLDRHFVKALALSSYVCKRNKFQNVNWEYEEIVTCFTSSRWVWPPSPLFMMEHYECGSINREHCQLTSSSMIESNVNVFVIWIYIVKVKVETSCFILSLYHKLVTDWLIDWLIDWLTGVLLRFGSISAISRQYTYL